MKTSQIPDQPASPAISDAASARIAALDVVRGVAVLGILAANIIGLGQPMAAAVWPGAFLAPPGAFADWLWGAQLVLVDGKFRGLFTLLFGAGMVLFLRRARERDAGEGLLALRLFWLGLLGFAHWALLWRGDILLTYAVAGLVVLAFASWDWPRQLLLGLIGYGAGALVDFVKSVPIAATARGQFPPGSHMAQVQAELLAAPAAVDAAGRAEASLILSSDYGGTVLSSLREHLAGLPAETLFSLFETVPLMLIGMGLLGAGVFDGRMAPRRQARFGWALWVIGTLATLPIAWWAVTRGIGYWDAFAAFNGWSALPNLAASVGLLALLALWGQRAKGWLAGRIAAAGRCAFTNYVGTSALALAVFSGWGLGLYGKLGRAELYGVMLLFWVVMLAWPKWWLAHFRHGPLEWLWRCLTYRRLLPLRR